MSGSYFFDSWLAKKNAIDYVKDKKLSSKSYINYMTIRLQKMFKYENLPETIPREILEYYLMINGTCYITKVDGDLYALMGTFGGEPDPYYKPTKYIVANPALHLSKEYDINKDGVLMRNDSIWQGLYPLMSRYACLMAENVLTIRSADVMLRVLAMLTAPDDKTKIAAEAYLKKLENGEFGVIAENRFFEGVKMQSPPSNNGSYLTQFIELHQYLKGSFYNEIGLNANFNMKREALGDGESSLNEDSLLPLCDEMLRCRQEDILKINEMFGTDISVEFDSSWAQNVIEKELMLLKMKNEASQQTEKNEPNDASQLADEEETPVGQITTDEVEETSDDATQLAESEIEAEEVEDASQLADEEETPVGQITTDEVEETSDDATQLAESEIEAEEVEDASQLADEETPVGQITTDEVEETSDDASQLAEIEINININDGGDEDEREVSESE